MQRVRRQSRRGEGPLAWLMVIGLGAAVLLLNGCVTVPEADIIRAQMAQRAHDQLAVAAQEVEALGEKQVQKDLARTGKALVEAYKADMAEAVTDGSVEGALQVVDKRDQKFAEMRGLEASKRAKYRAVAAKLRIGAQAVKAVDEIAQHQSEATAKAWKGFLTEDLPSIATEAVSSYASAKAAAEATKATEPATPAEPDTTDLIDGGGQ